jgi:hypothetical protein
MTEQFPAEPNIYMAEGTAAHGLVYDILKNNRQKKSFAYPNEREVDGFTVKVMPEMIDAVWQFVEYVRSKTEHGAIIKLEEKIRLPQVHEALFATPDVRVLIPFKKLYVFDFKYGSGKKVSAFDNKQLRYYALYDAMNEDVDEIELTIVQPRYQGGWIDVETLTYKHLMAFKEELKVRAANALRQEAPLVAGPWCHSTFCPAAAQCPSVAAKAKELIARDFSEAPSPRSLTLKQIKNVLDHADFLTNWIAKVKDHAKEIALQGEKIPGYKLVQSYGHRAWRSEEAVHADLGTRYGDDIFEPPKLKSPAKLEKIVGKDIVERYAFKPENGYKLVTEDEKGEEVKTITAQEDFK